MGVAAALVEGSTRRTTRDYAHFVTIALGSASEVRYLLSVRRLAMLETEASAALGVRYDELVRGLQALISALDQVPDAR